MWSHTRALTDGIVQRGLSYWDFSMCFVYIGDVTLCQSAKDHIFVLHIPSIGLLHIRFFLKLRCQFLVLPFFSFFIHGSRESSNIIQMQSQTIRMKVCKCCHLLFIKDPVIKLGCRVTASLYLSDAIKAQPAALTHSRRRFLSPPL